jgi:electron transport complex protein RnfD
MTSSQPKADTATGGTRGHLTLSSLPHVHGGAATSQFMLGILFALIPAAVMAVITAGAMTAVSIIAAIAAAYATDWTLTYLREKRSRRFDGSALATGMLLALSCPPHLPVWVAPLGVVFAIAIAKQATGGLGRNFLNPALAGRAFLAISFPQYFAAVAGHGAAGQLPLHDMLYSLATGSPAAWIGAVSPAAIIAGAAVLWYLRIIDVTLPLCFILSAFALFWSANITAGIMSVPATALETLTPFLSSGILFGALFMATDPVTSPGMRSGRLLYGIGCGTLMFVFSLRSAPGNALMYAILIMNCTVPLFDAAIVRRSLGGNRRSFRSELVSQAIPPKEGAAP